jgi:hypothetical protein
VTCTWEQSHLSEPQMEGTPCCVSQPLQPPCACRVIAETGVQFISCGALTHSVTALDISLNIQTQ